MFQLLERGHKITQCIHQNNNYTLLGTKELLFKDWARMLAAGTSLDKFLSANGFPGKCCKHSTEGSVAQCDVTHARTQAIRQDCVQENCYSQKVAQLTIMGQARGSHSWCACARAHDTTGTLHA